MQVDESDVDVPRRDLIALYRDTHRDFFDSEPSSDPSAADVDDLYRSPLPSTGYFSSLYDPGATTLKADRFEGGGSGASVCSPSALADQLGLTCDPPGASVWTNASRIASSVPAGKVNPVPDYTFVRELRRSVAVDDQTVLHHLPIFEEPIKMIKFDRVQYESSFLTLEYTLNFDRPRLNTIMYEFLRRLTLVHPTFSLDDNPRALNFLPTDVDDVLLLPHRYELLPFPNPNPSTRAGRYGDPSVRMELGRWAKGGRLADHWTGRLRANESILCPMAACGEYDCELHSAVIDSQEAVIPRSKGGPASTEALLSNRRPKKPCPNSCYATVTNERLDEQTMLGAQADRSSSWSDADLDELMAVLTSVPDLLPCEMVDLFLSDSGAHRHSCYEVFLARCSIVDITPSRPPAPRAAAAGSGKSAKASYDLAHSRMKITRPCHHQGPCIGKKGCACATNKVHCDKACGCDLTCRRRFGIHPKKPQVGCACHGSGVRCRTLQCECFKDQRDCDPNICGSCGADDPASGRCSNIQIQLGRTKATEVLPTTHGNGLFLGPLESVVKDEFIIEYIGELISHEEGTVRGMIYDQIQRNYLFDLNASLVLDGFSRGNQARFINHPDDEVANCYPKVLHVLGEHRVGIFAKRSISGGEELLFHYGNHFKLPSQKGTSTQDSSRATQESLPPKKKPKRTMVPIDLDSTPEP